MQTILGAGGAIGRELAKALTAYTTDIRLVSRNPEKVNDSDTLMSANLTARNDVFDAVKGSSIVYLTVGLTYDLKTWQTQWPVIMKNVIESCEYHKAKLVFFDNIYMYDGSNLNPITEDLPMNPPSKKGAVRKQLVEMIQAAIAAGRIEALIARSADFYGPGIDKVSMLTETIIKPISEGKAANLMGGENFKHTYTYVPDAARAVALLGNTPTAYNQTWHLPTASNAPSAKEWVELFARGMGEKPKYRVTPKWMIRIIGLFMPIMKELHEMVYQYDRDYVFSSEKFNQAFPQFHTTPYEKGIAEIIKADYAR